MVDLSIIVPAYNHEKYIQNTVLSLICQKTCYSYEILIGDDASIDSTNVTVMRIANQYPGLIRFFRRESNVGATKNGYYLMKAARGRYLAFCDGDDLWSDENRIQRHITFLDEHSDFSGICGRNNLIDDNGEILNTNDIISNDHFWRCDYDIYSITHFSRWEMPGHVSALTIRNFMNSEKQHDYSVFYKAHDTVGDRSLVLISVLTGDIKCERNCVSSYRYRINRQDNYMSQFKQHNMYGKDFKMIRSLESYALGEFGVKINLEGIKKDRLIASIVKMMKNNCFENRMVVKQIINYSGTPFTYMAYTLKVLIIKWVYWNILKTDKRIEL